MKKKRQMKERQLFYNYNITDAVDIWTPHE